MKRAVCLFLFLVNLGSNAVHAQFGTPAQHAPTIVVVSSAGDARLRLVDDAVSFWDKMFHAFAVTQGSLLDLRVALAEGVASVDVTILGETRQARRRVAMGENTVDPATGMAAAFVR
jgi:hypothetical protein